MGTTNLQEHFEVYQAALEKEFEDAWAKYGHI